MEEPIVKVYVACPTVVSLTFLNEVEKLIREYGGTPYHWDRKTRYNSDIMNYASIVVAITNDSNQWTVFNAKIPKGTRSEIDLALLNQIPTFVTYAASHGLQIYKMSREGNKDRDSVGGIAGTSGELRDLILSIKKEIKFKQARVEAALDWSETKTGRVESGKPNIPQQIPAVSSKNMKDGKFKSIMEELEEWEKDLKIGTPSIIKEVGSNSLKEDVIIDLTRQLPEYSYLTQEEKDKLLLITIH